MQILKLKDDKKTSILSFYHPLIHFSASFFTKSLAIYDFSTVGVQNLTSHVA